LDVLGSLVIGWSRQRDVGERTDGSWVHGGCRGRLRSRVSTWQQHVLAMRHPPALAPPPACLPTCCRVSTACHCAHRTHMLLPTAPAPGPPQPLYNLASGMPHTEAWRGADLSKDPAADLQAAERTKRTGFCTTFLQIKPPGRCIATVLSNLDEAGTGRACVSCRVTSNSISRAVQHATFPSLTLHMQLDWWHKRMSAPLLE